MTHEERASSLSHEQIVALLVENENLKRQNEWFKSQIFGEKSERRPVDADSRQLLLGEWGATVEDEGLPVREHVRRRRKNEREDESDLRFDESVPVEEIRLDAPDASPDSEIVSEKITYRLAQRPGSYVVLKYIRPVAKSRDGKLSCASAPVGVLGKSCADVSLLAGIAVDKFRYHLPLYRQHQRLGAAGIRLARSTLTAWMQRVADLLEPIYQAQLSSILSSRVVAMDETPIKAGQSGKRGRMKTGYFWPIYGDAREVVFPFASTRSASVVRQVLREYGGVLLSDGYKAYDSYAGEINHLIHAQCWAHTRRHFIEAECAEPRLVAEAVARFQRLYDEERRLNQLGGAQKIQRRAERCKPIVDEFFLWLKRTLVDQLLLPSNPWTKAARYALDREKSLRVFLEYPDVPLDTNHLEREIRPIALGRKNWLFCWTELGAKDVGVFQSLIATCRLHGIDAYTYLVDVLQRIDQHPMAEVAMLTPRLWKDNFATDPLRSDLDRLRKNAES